LHTDFDSTVKAMTRMGRAFEPDSHTHALYDELFHKVYKRMYRQLQPLYTRLRAISKAGYQSK
jgi:sugar (pentulose or hexulose) kinase